MKPPYAPPQRRVPVELLTSAGWVRGQLVLPALHPLQEHLSAEGEFVVLTEAHVGGHEGTVPFLAVRRSAITVLLTQHEEQMTACRADERAVNHEVICLLDVGSLKGTLRIAAGLRVSDFIQRHTGFLSLGHAMLRLRSSLPSPGDGRLSCLVNAQNIVAITELPAVEPAVSAHPGQVAATPVKA